MAQSKYNVLDLFCGCGGLSKGFEEAGYNVIVGVDFEQSALNTFNRNHKGAVGLRLDLSAYESFDAITQAVNGRNVDVIIGGPPCQGFSLTGSRNFDDERNKLYLAMIETVRRFKPKAFMIENVPGMANLYKGAVKDEIIKRFTLMGYTVSYKIVCAADYGVPQVRNRLVFIGLLDAKDAFEFPKPYLTPENYITCEDAISDLPPLVDSLGDEVSKYESEPQNEFQRMMRGGVTLYFITIRL